MVASSFVKRHSEGQRWTDYVVEKVWCDPSDLALGAVVKIGDAVAEDAA